MTAQVTLHKLRNTRTKMNKRPEEQLKAMQDLIKKHEERFPTDDDEVAEELSASPSGSKRRDENSLLYRMRQRAPSELGLYRRANAESLKIETQGMNAGQRTAYAKQRYDQLPDVEKAMYKQQVEEEVAKRQRDDPEAVWR